MGKKKNNKRNDSKTEENNKLEDGFEKIVFENLPIDDDGDAMDDSILHILSQDEGEGMDKYPSPPHYASLNDAFGRTNESSFIHINTDDKYISQQEGNLINGQFTESEKDDNEESKLTIWSKSFISKGSSYNNNNVKQADNPAPQSSKWNPFNCACGTVKEEVELNNTDLYKSNTGSSGVNDTPTLESQATAPSRTRNASIGTYTFNTLDDTNTYTYDDNTIGSFTLNSYDLQHRRASDSVSSSGSSSYTFLTFETNETETEASLQGDDYNRNNRKSNKFEKKKALSYQRSYSLDSVYDSYDIFEDVSTIGSETNSTIRSDALDKLEKYRPPKFQSKLKNFSSSDNGSDSYNSQDESFVASGRKL